MNRECPARTINVLSAELKWFAIKERSSQCQKWMEQVLTVRDQKLVAALEKAAPLPKRKNYKSWEKEWEKNDMPEMKIVVKEREGGLEGTELPPDPQRGD